LGVLRALEFEPVELSNTAWAWATISVCHAPLLDAISASLLPKLEVTDTQGLSNTAWAFATISFWDEPFRDAISSASLNRRDANAQNITTLVWSWWKMGRSLDVWPEIERSVDQGISLDSMGFSYSLMMSEWAKIEHRENMLYGMMEGSQEMRLPIQLFELVSRWRGSASGGPPSLGKVSHPYQKIAMLLDFVESQVRVGDDSSFLHAIEQFGAGIGQWLKVAADCKAELVEASMKRRGALRSEACAEFGTFVGYTAMRLARWVASDGPAPGRSVHLEVDPIHALVTRHQLSLAWLSPGADVWIGQALDLIPRLAEELGTSSLCLAFMDHRGTKFHSDLFRLQRNGVLAPGATHVCDNTLKPGAPVCLWLMAYDPLQHTAWNWSLNEFAHWNSEDWMLVNVL